MSGGQIPRDHAVTFHSGRQSTPRPSIARRSSAVPRTLAAANPNEIWSDTEPDAVDGVGEASDDVASGPEDVPSETDGGREEQ